MTAAARRSILPGFGLTLGFTITYVSLLVVIPLAMLVLRSAGGGWSHFVETATSPRALASFRFTVLASAGAAMVNLVFGTVLAWVLVRYPFPGRRFVDALVDVPLALPTAVAGIALTTVYSGSGWVGSRLEPLGIKVAFTPLGAMIALVFVGLPFMVRTLQPVIEELDPAVEEAASTLGASRFQTFWRVVFPLLVPAMRAGFGAAFARALGEYGSVIFIAGNMPMKTEISALLIMTKLEQYDYAGAATLGVVMVVVSFGLLVLLHKLQPASEKRHARV